jgi:predicted MFS family arabinose efflux permease
VTAAPRGLGVYREVLAVPGAPVLVTSGLVARLPISMLGIGIVLLVEAEYGSYGTAGLVAAAYAVVSSVCSPLVSRAVDRLGQARVMRPAIAVHLVGTAGLLLAATAQAPLWVLFAAVAVMGSTIGSIGALVRARWLHVLARAERREPAGPDAAGAGGPDAEGGGGLEGRVNTAFSLESVVDEVVFITGPLIVTAAAAAVSPVLGLVVAAVAVGTGGAVLMAQRSTEPPPTPGRAPKGSSVVAARGMLTLLTVFLAAGGLFGAVEVVVVAFTDERGTPVAAGPVLAAYALGSLLAGIGYGAVRWASPPGRRFTVASLVFAAGMVPVALVSTVPALAAVLFVAGLAVAPTLIAGNALVREVVASGRLTEGLTWVSTALGVGVAAGAAVGGAWVDAAGARSALSLPAVCGAVAAVVVLLGHRRLVPRR